MVNKRARRAKIKNRIRKSIKGTSVKPRLSIFRSNKSIYCQLIQDVDGVTLAAASSKEESIESSGTKLEQAKKVGELLATRAKGQDIEEVIFDRSGYLYHGRLKSLAEGAREGGLKF